MFPCNYDFARRTPTSGNSAESGRLNAMGKFRPPPCKAMDLGTEALGQRCRESGIQNKAVDTSSRQEQEQVG